MENKKIEEKMCKSYLDYKKGIITEKEYRYQVDIYMEELLRENEDILKNLKEKNSEYYNSAQMLKMFDDMVR